MQAVTSPSPFGGPTRARVRCACQLAWPIGPALFGLSRRCRVSSRGVSSRNLRGPLGRARARPTGLARLRASRRRGIRGKSLVTSFYSPQSARESNSNMLTFHVIQHNSRPFWLKLGRIRFVFQDGVLHFSARPCIAFRPFDAIAELAKGHFGQFQPPLLQWAENHQSLPMQLQRRQKVAPKKFTLADPG